MAKVSKDSFNKTQKLCNKLVCKVPSERMQNCSAKENSLMFFKEDGHCVVVQQLVKMNRSAFRMMFCCHGFWDSYCSVNLAPVHSCSQVRHWPDDLAEFTNLSAFVVSVELSHTWINHFETYQWRVLRDDLSAGFILTMHFPSFSVTITCKWYNPRDFVDALQIPLSLEKKQRILVRSIRNPKLKCKRKRIIKKRDILEKWKKK